MEANRKSTTAALPAERKAKSRARSISLMDTLTAVTNECLENEPQAGTATQITKLQRAILAVMQAVQKQQKTAFQAAMARTGLMLSRTIGTFLIQTGDLKVLEVNSALDYWWMITEQGQGISSLAGQSLWSIVHWDSHKQVEEMQQSFRSRDRSIVGKSFDLCMIRMTNSLELGGFGMAKAVRRRVGVLHLSEDGATALLDVVIKDEDTRALDMGDEGREWCKDVHTFNFKLDETAPESERKYLREQAGTSAGANGPDEPSGQSTGGVGAAFVDLESIFFSMAEYATNFKIVVGPSHEQSRNLRHMVFSKLSLSESLASPFIPITNIRMGEWKEGSEMTRVNGRIRSKDMAWQGWFLPGDDRHSQKFPWQFVAAARTGNSRDKARAATYGENFLSCFFSRDHVSHSSDTGVAVEYVQFSQTGPIVSTRRIGNVEEGRPYYSDTPKMTLAGEWDGMEEEIPQVEQLFREWSTAPTFYDLKDMIQLMGNTP